MVGFFKVEILIIESEAVSCDDFIFLKGILA